MCVWRLLMHKLKCYWCYAVSPVTSMLRGTQILIFCLFEGKRQKWPTLRGEAIIVGNILEGRVFQIAVIFLLSLDKKTFWPFNPFVMLKYCSVNIEHWSIKINITCVYVYNMKLQKNYTAAVTTVTPNPLCPPITKTMLRELESQKLFFQRQ